MTKYREILRLKALNLSQHSIADSCSVSKKTVNRVLKRAEELGILGHSTKTTPMLYWQKSFFLLPSRFNPVKGCLILITSARSYSATE